MSKDSPRKAIELPDDSYKLLFWRVSEGSSVQVGETVAFAIPKNVAVKTTNGAVTAGTATTTKLKRATKRQKPGASVAKVSSAVQKSEAEEDAPGKKQKEAAAPVSKPEADGRIPVVATTAGLVKYDVSASSGNRIGYIEVCTHPTFVEGMCVVCGMSQADVEPADKPSGVSQVTVAGQTVSVSKEEGEQMARMDAERLVKAKKLALVLDLDHTLVHATHDVRAKPVWEARDDVRTLVLPLVDNAGTPQTNKDGEVIWMQHFVKLRPHVKEFLADANKEYEVGVYTAGTRLYAEQICILLARDMVGAKLDEPELALLRHRVDRMEKELAKAESLLNEVPGGKEESEPSAGKKRKRVGFGAPSENEKSDGATKEELDKLKNELREAEALESEAIKVRNDMFGSRLVSRTDVGDLGHDVKSLKRIFPCGGTMAVVMDDREDVWANATDVVSSRKGEPPENLLLVRPYHWKSFLGFADVNNASGADLSGRSDDENGDTKEADVQLVWSGRLLHRIHERYYSAMESGMARRTIPDLVKQMRAETLDGASLVLSGLVPLHRQDKDDVTKPRPSVVRYAESLGATLLPAVNPTVTHVVAAGDGTDKIRDARRTPGCFVVKASWLMESYWSLTRAEEREHLLGAPPKAASGTDSEEDSEDDELAAELESEMMG